MERPGPGRDYGSAPSGARVEDDFTRPLTPIKAPSRRLSAALPLAVVAMLVVATVAFGATVIRPMVVGPDPSATPVDGGDDQPDETPTATATVTLSPTPTATPTKAPTAPPTAAPTAQSNGLTLTARLSGTKVVLTWTAYSGEDFAYYKVVRSSDKTAAWPLGTGDTLVAAIGDVAKLTFTDCPPAGKTWSYEVFAVKTVADGYAVLTSTNLVAIAVPAPTARPTVKPTVKPTPKPTPKPTTSCGISLTYKVVHAQAQLTWTKYHCANFEDYVVVRSNSSTVDVPLPNDGTSAMQELGDVNALTWTDDSVKPGHTYYYRVMAWTSKTFCEGGTVLAKTNMVKVTIPAAATPTPSE
jgi:hypothetical protein